MLRLAHFIAWLPLVAVGCSQRFISPHPVFQTIVSGQSQSRPAIKVDIKDDSEHIFFTAELYLTVQSSRFPSDTRILLPLNVGDFAGCRSRFVQMPFEVAEGDMLIFNLLDDDYLTPQQEQAVISACQACGYCVVAAGKVYDPNTEAILQPVVPVAAEILGKAIVDEISLNHFDNYGTAEFIVPNELPTEPQSANQLSVTDSDNYVPVVLRLYGPVAPLSFPAALAKSL